MYNFKAKYINDSNGVIHEFYFYNKNLQYLYTRRLI